MKTFNAQIKTNSISYAIIFGGIIVLIVLLSILPFYRYNDNRRQDINKIETAIEEQKGLRQVYTLLTNATQKKDVYTLPNPQKARLPRENLHRFQETFRESARKSGLMIIRLMPDIKTAAGGSQSLLYSTTLKGEFANLRKLLIDLGGMPYVSHIGEINMQQRSDSIEIKMQIWVALAD